MSRTLANGLLLGILLTMLAPVWLHAQGDWRLKQRLQIGAERDNNIFETPRNEVATLAGRMLYSNQLQKKWRRSTFSMQYAGGLQLYPQYAEENKTIHDLSGALRWQISSRVSVHGQLRGNTKIYFDAPIDFAHTYSGFTVNTLLPGKVLLSLLASSSRLDYADFDAFDYANRQFGAKVARVLPAGFTIEGAFSFSTFTFTRQAYRLDNSDPNPILTPLPFQQQDDQWSAHLRLRFGKKYIAHLTGEYVQNEANSFGYSYEQVRLSAILGVKLGRPWLLRLAAMAQFKNYREDIAPVIQRTLDPESDENNFLVADVSYDYTDRLAYLLRLAFYKNEAALRGNFYRKMQLFIGAEYRF